MYHRDHTGAEKEIGRMSEVFKEFPTNNSGNNAGNAAEQCERLAQTLDA